MARAFLIVLDSAGCGGAPDAAEFGDATNMLAIPLWPFYALIVLGAALYATMLVIQVADLWRCGVNKHV